MSNNARPSLSEDLTKALNLTLRPGRVAVLAFGLLIGVAAVILFFWLGGLISPEKYPALQWLAWVIKRIGAVIFAYVILASMSSVVAMAHAESTGEKIAARAGWALLTRNIGPVIFGTIKPIGVFLGLVALIWVAGVLGAIPGFGPIGWSFLSIVALPAGLLAIFIIVKLFIVSFLFPTVLSLTKQKGAACYKESVRFIKGHVAHILGRLGVAVLVCFVFYAIITAGFALTASQSSRTMGNNRATLVGSPVFDWLAGVPGIRGTAPRGLAVENPAASFRHTLALRPTGARRVGGWIFSVIFIVVAVIPLSLPFLFLALSGYCAYLSFKDAPELPLRTEAVDWSGIKETAQEIAGKRKSKSPEKPAEESSGD